MRISSVHIVNFRGFADETIPFADYTCLVGPNGGGKSTILYALNLFFRSTESVPSDLSRPREEDFHHKNIKEPVLIQLTFTDLSDSAKQAFSHYVRHNQLVISAKGTFNPESGYADVHQYGERLGMKAFAPFFSKRDEGAKAAELKDIYSEIRKTFVGLPPPGTKDGMANALSQYETSHEDACVLLQSKDQFYGWSRGTGLLEKYVQWIYVPAVKDASEEQMEARNSAFSKLLDRTVNLKSGLDEGIAKIQGDVRSRYKTLMKENEGALTSIAESLNSRLSQWAHPDAKLRLEWSDQEKSVAIPIPMAKVVLSEGDFEGEVSRFGHGLQRSYLLALLQELAASDGSGAPRLILGCEEPELYQHPPQARHLAGVLEKLSEANSQILVCTHSPIFVSGKGFERVRMIRKDSKAKSSTSSVVSYDQISKAIAEAKGEPANKPVGALAKVHQSLQPSLSEMFFTSRLILVEGLEDVGYISAYLNLMDKWEEYRRLGCHVVATNGKSEMIQALAIAQAMKIPTFVVFDSDADKADKAGSRTKHERDNKALLCLCGCNSADAMPKETLWKDKVVMWHSDIGSVVEDDIGKSDWEKYNARADQQYGHAGSLSKNMLHIGAALAFAWEENKKSDHLRLLCEAILKFGGK